MFLEDTRTTARPTRLFMISPDRGLARIAWAWEFEVWSRTHSQALPVSLSGDGNWTGLGSLRILCSTSIEYAYCTGSSSRHWWSTSEEKWHLRKAYAPGRDNSQYGEGVVLEGRCLETGAAEQTTVSAQWASSRAHPVPSISPLSPFLPPTFLLFLLSSLPFFPPFHSAFSFLLSSFPHSFPLLYPHASLLSLSVLPLFLVLFSQTVSY